jgi:hypothetical protein
MSVATTTCIFPKGTPVSAVPGENGTMHLRIADHALHTVSIYGDIEEVIDFLSGALRIALQCQRTGEKTQKWNLDD